MPEPGFFDETHWHFAIQFNDVNGAPLDLTGKEQLRAILYDKHGREVFRWLALGAAGAQGTIDVSDIALGLVVLEATLEQHENVPDGQPYTWTLYDIEDDADPRYIANGRAYIGRPGETATTFTVIGSYDGSEALAVIIAIKGDKGDDGDITEELEELRQETFTARDEAEAAAADAAQSAIDAAQEAEQALAARIGAEAAEADAELAAAAAAALGGPIYPDVATALATATNGDVFVTQGPDPEGGLIIYRDIGGSPEEAQQIGTLAGSGEVAALDARVDLLDPLLDVITTYLDPFPIERPLWLYDDGHYDTYLLRLNNSPDNWEFVSPQTIRLDIIETVVDPGTELTPDYNGRVTVSEDGTVLGGRRVSDDITQYGPAPERDYRAWRTGADGAGVIWAAAEGIPPFKLTNELTGDNIGLTPHGFEAVSWLNIPSGDVPAYQHFSFLPGIQPGALLSSVSKLTLMIHTGQSTEAGIKSHVAGAVLTTTCPATGKIVMFDVTPPDGTPRGPRVSATEQGPLRAAEPLDWRTLKTLVPAFEMYEGDSGETQCTQAGYEFQKRMGADHAAMVATVAIGSQGYSGIKIGTVPGDNLLQVVRTAWAIAKMNDLEFDVVVCWAQHEASVTDTQAQFLAKYVEFQSDVTAAVDLITGGEVANVVFVTNGYTNGAHYNHAYTEEALAQLEFATTYPTKGVYSTPCFVLERVADGVHFSRVGGARNGSYMGRAVANLKLGNDALPLYTTAVGIDAGTIRGQLHLPWGHGTLATSSPIVTDPGNFGFKIVRVDTQADVPITSVSITGGNEWICTPTAPPAGVLLEVSHGFRGGALLGSGGPTAGARCPINDDHPDVDFFGNAFANHLASQRFFVTF